MSVSTNAAASLVAGLVTVLALSSCAAVSGGGTEADLALAQDARQVLEQGESDPIYAAVSEADLKLAQVENGDTWRGPREAPAPAEGKSITVIPIVAGGTPLEVAEALEGAAGTSSWETTVIDARGTPAGMQQAFSTALNNGSDAIFTVAIPVSFVGDSLESAHAAGVPTIGMSSDPEEGSVNYDAYLPSNETFSAKFEAWYAIADSEGTAKVAMI